MIKRMLHSTGPIGIDLGEDGARILQLGYERGGLGVVASARLDLHTLNLEHDPDDPAPDELIRAIAKRVVAGGFRGRQCMIALPDRAFTARSARLPEMPLGELSEAVRLDAPAHLGMDQIEGGVQIGWMKTGDIHQGDDHRIELLYFGAPTERLEQLAYAFEGAGLEPVGIEPHFVSATRAMTRTLRRTADAETTQLVIDVCQDHSTVLITKGDTLAFSKVVGVGGRAMTDAAMQKLGLDDVTVRELRRQRMTKSKDEISDARIERALFDAVRPTMAQIAHEVSLCLRHFSVTFRGTRPARALLIGSEAREPGFDSVIADSVGLETAVGDPFEAIGTDHVVGGAKYGPAWAASVGIGIRDLLKQPPSRKRSQRRSRTAAKAAQKSAQAPVQKRRAA